MADLSGLVDLNRTDTGATIATISVTDNGDGTATGSIVSGTFSNTTVPIQAHYRGSTDGISYLPGDSNIVTEELLPPPANVAVALLITPNPQATNGNQTYLVTVTPAS